MNQYVNEANELLQMLCIKYGLKCIKARPKIFNSSLRPAKFCGKENCIAINVNYLSGYDKKIFHEFRHYWQRETYPKVYFWWLTEHKELYKDFQKSKKIVDGKKVRLAYIYCPLEKDAIAFEDNDEGDEDGLRNPILDESYWRKILEENTDEVSDDDTN